MNDKIFQKLLIPTDFSDLSLTALDYVRSFITFQNTTIYLMHVVEDAPVMAFPAVQLDAETILRAAEQEALSDLNRIVKEKAIQSGQLIPLIRRGNPYKVITGFAQANQVDLIVIATHGRTGVAHAIMGSVAEKVVRHSTTPVLTVKPVEMLNSFVHEIDVDEQLHIPH